MRRTYVNPEPPDGEAPQPEAAPQPSGASKAGSFLRSMAVVGVSAIVGVIAVDIYRRIKDRNTEPDALPMGNPGMGAMPMMGGGTVVPIPIPWPMGGPGFMAPPQINAPTPNESKMNKAEELELARLNTERAKAEALKAQMEAFLEGDD